MRNARPSPRSEPPPLDVKRIVSTLDTHGVHYLLIGGLGATLYGENTIDRGRMTQTNFHDYPMLKLAEMPKIETVLVPSFDFWGGVGEPTICVVGPAVMNAIFAATGKPIRTLPMRNPVEALGKA